MAMPPWGPWGGATASRRCGFCGRREESVEHLVRARDVYICDGCVAVAREAIAAAPAEQTVLRIKARAQLPDDPASAEEAIEQAFEVLLGGNATVAERQNVIEGGSNLGPVMQQVEERFPARRHMDVFVEHIRFLDPAEAEVHFVLLFPGGSPLPRIASTGYAVLSNGVWKVARQTYCELVGRIGVQCPPPPLEA